MHTSEPTNEKFKCVCEDLPNMVILTRSTTPREEKMTFMHASVGNKSPGESVTPFTLVGSLEAPALVSINADIAFAYASNNIWLPVTEVLLLAAISNLAGSKKQWDWVALNTVIL